jgi:hypothetical protein
VAVTVVVPSEMPATAPSLAPIVAMAGSADDHSTENGVCLPAESIAVAAAFNTSTMRPTAVGEIAMLNDEAAR